MSSFTPNALISRRFARQPVDKQSLETILAFMLDDAEKLLGPRIDPRPYHFTGIYCASSHPRFEYGVDAKGNKRSRIRLSSGCLKRHGSAIWQLSHECVHLLTAAQTRPTVLEEGLAGWYQKLWVRSCPDLFSDWAKSPDRTRKGWCGPYDAALGLANYLMSYDPELIKRLRQAEPIISKITDSMILELASDFDKSIAENLVKRFNRTRAKRDKSTSNSQAFSGVTSPKNPAQIDS